MKKRNTRHSLICIWGALFVILTWCGFIHLDSKATRNGSPNDTRFTSTESTEQRVADLHSLLNLKPQILWDIPIAQLNLLCAAGLSPDTIDPSQATDQISSWADHVRSETERHLYRFRKNPVEFENSDGLFRMLMLAVVLAEDFHIQYDPNRITAPGTGSGNDGFFANPNPVFLTGLLGPKRLGTCSSMPVLYVTIGRQLGYPLYLVTTKGHLFVRWDGKGERFNIEATSHGLNRFSDDYYRHWPFEITPEEERAEGYLKSLSPPEELAAFLSIRGMCLHERGRIREAAESFSHAAQLAPAVRSYKMMLSELQIQTLHLATKPEPPKL